MWDRPGSGIKPVSPVLAVGFFSTEPQGKHQNRLLTWRKKKEYHLLAKILSISPPSHPLDIGFALGLTPLRVQDRDRVPFVKYRENYIQRQKETIFSSISLVLRTLFPEALWQTFPLPPMPRILTLKSVTGKRD